MVPNTVHKPRSTTKVDELELVKLLTNVQNDVLRFDIIVYVAVGVYFGDGANLEWIRREWLVGEMTWTKEKWEEKVVDKQTINRSRF